MKPKQNLLVAAFACVLASNTTAFAQAADSPYKFERGFPTAETIQKAYDLCFLC